MMPGISESLDLVRQEISDAARRSGRTSNDVSLVAVSKKQSPEKIAESVAAGQTLFGENKVQEARAKIPQLPGALRWHCIGHLQKNKIRHALPLFEMIESVDSLELAQQIDRIAGELGMNPRILLEVNVAGDAAKFGFSPVQLERCLEELLNLPRLQIEGMMTIPPLAREAEDSRRHFVALRELRERLERDFKVGLPELSMGMSNDYKIAVEEGATFVRVGSAIFGER